jgi:DNA-binding response OmpR family regulator
MPKKILVVDDEPHMVELLKAILGAEGFHVVTANKGEKALELLKKEKPDLLLLDMMMPGMSGREVAEKIRANPKTKDLKIIFVTVAQFSESGREVLEKLDVADYITKPFDNSDLVARVKKVI